MYFPSPSKDEEARRQTGRRKVMAWLARNWFWVLIAIAFIAMHVFGIREALVNKAGTKGTKTLRKDAP